MRLLLTIITLACTGCANQGGSKSAGQSRDAFTAATGEAIVLAAPRPGLSHTGMDYLVAGPMTVNLGGSSERMLYLGFGSTIDRRITGAEEPSVATVVFELDSLLMTFDLRPWEQARDTLPYDPSLLARQDYAVRVTRSQLQALADADSLSAWVTDADGRSPVYRLVRGDTADLVSRPGSIR